VARQIRVIHREETHTVVCLLLPAGAILHLGIRSFQPLKAASHNKKGNKSGRGKGVLCYPSFCSATSQAGGNLRSACKSKAGSYLGEHWAFSPAPRFPSRPFSPLPVQSAFNQFCSCWNWIAHWTAAHEIKGCIACHLLGSDVKLS
jgi:hypothetical protein